jgi:hypothetical protein
MSMFVFAYLQNLYAIQQRFSLKINQQTMFLIMTFLPNKQAQVHSHGSHLGAVCFQTWMSCLGFDLAHGAGSTCLGKRPRQGWGPNALSMHSKLIDKKQESLP